MRGHGHPTGINKPPRQQPLPVVDPAAVTADERADRALVQILLPMSDGSLHALGTGCIIRPDQGDPQSNGDPNGLQRIPAALVLTAKHIFDYIEKLDAPNQRHAATTPPEFRAPRPTKRSLNRAVMKAVRRVNGNPYACTIETVRFLEDPDTDLALCIIVHDEPHRRLPFDSAFTLDTETPAVGSKLLALGFDRMDTIEEKEESQDSKRLLTYRVNWNRSVRECEVTAIHDGGHGIVKGPCFEVSVPLDSGMSGGPVLDREALTVRGIVSSGVTLIGAEASGKASLLWPLAGLSLPTSSASANDVGFLELLRGGVIHDLGKLHERCEVFAEGGLRKIRKLE